MISCKRNQQRATLMMTLMPVLVMLGLPAAEKWWRLNTEKVHRVRQRRPPWSWWWWSITRVTLCHIAWLFVSHDYQDYFAWYFLYCMVLHDIASRLSSWTFSIFKNSPDFVEAAAFGEAGLNIWHITQIAHGRVGAQVWKDTKNSVFFRLLPEVRSPINLPLAKHWIHSAVFLLLLLLLLLLLYCWLSCALLMKNWKMLKSENN